MQAKGSLNQKQKAKSPDFPILQGYGVNERF
jgi:hypothetical protein